MWELSKSFRFEAAHTLERVVDSAASRRVHGHSYRAEVTLRGTPDAATGMLIDLGSVEAALEQVRAALDHRFLDDVPGLGPATLENLSAWIWRNLPALGGALSRVTVYRDSTGEASSYLGPRGD